MYVYLPLKYIIYKALQHLKISFHIVTSLTFYSSPLNPKDIFLEQIFQFYGFSLRTSLIVFIVHP